MVHRLLGTVLLISINRESVVMAVGLPREAVPIFFTMNQMALVSITIYVDCIRKHVPFSLENRIFHLHQLKLYSYSGILKEHIMPEENLRQDVADFVPPKSKF